MKTITLLVASVLLCGNLANASEIINYSGERTRTNFNSNEPIEFTERGITFYVFPNGEFDFNTEQTVGNDNYYRRAVNTTNGAPRVVSMPNTSGTVIEHDALGRVRRVGNVFINYDYENRIKRIGTIYMSYNRFALDQVGGLKIIYNRKGQIIDMLGNVKGYGNNYGYTCSNNTYYNSNNYSESQNNSNNQYYYRKGKSNTTEK